MQKTEFFFLLQNKLIHLCSTQGPIEVYLCPEETDYSTRIKTQDQDHNGNISRNISKSNLNTGNNQIYAELKIKV